MFGVGIGDGVGMVMCHNGCCQKECGWVSMAYTLTHQIFMPPQFASLSSLLTRSLPLPPPTIRHIRTPNLFDDCVCIAQQGVKALIPSIYAYCIIASAGIRVFASRPPTTTPPIYVQSIEKIIRIYAMVHVRTAPLRQHHLFIPTGKWYSNRFRFDFGDHLFAQLVN